MSLLRASRIRTFLTKLLLFVFSLQQIMNLRVRCKNCLYMCAFHCQLYYTMQHRTVLIFFSVIVQTVISKLLQCTHTHTHNRLTGLCPWLLRWTILEETFTHSHQPWSSNILYQLSPFTAIQQHPPCSIYVLESPFHNLFPGPLWSTSWSGTFCFVLHTFLHPIIIFFSPHMPV